MLTRRYAEPADRRIDASLTVLLSSDMLTAISRYGARVLPNTEQTHRGAARPAASSSRVPRSPSSKRAFAGGRGRRRRTAIAAAYGRMAFYYILKALDLPPGSEIIFRR